LFSAVEFCLFCLHTAILHHAPTHRQTERQTEYNKHTDKDAILTERNGREKTGNNYAVFPTCILTVVACVCGVSLSGSVCFTFLNFVDPCNFDVKS